MSPFRELAGIDAEEDELADERVAPELERQRTEFRVVVGGSQLFGMSVGVDALRRRDVERAGKIIDDRIDEILDALVLEGGTADDRDKLISNGQPADARFQYLWA